MQGFGTDQTALINVLVSIPPLRLPPLAAAYRQTNSKDLLPLLEKELTGNLEQVLMCRVRGEAVRLATQSDLIKLTLRFRQGRWAPV